MSNMPWNNEKNIFKKFLFLRDGFTWKKPFLLNYVVLSKYCGIL